MSHRGAADTESSVFDLGTRRGQSSLRQPEDVFQEEDREQMLKWNQENAKYLGKFMVFDHRHLGRRQII